MSADLTLPDSIAAGHATRGRDLAAGQSQRHRGPDRVVAPQCPVKFGGCESQSGDAASGPVDPATATNAHDPRGLDGPVGLDGLVGHDRPVALDGVRPDGTPRADHASSSISSRIADYVELTKPRIVTMILVTTAASAMIAAGGPVPAFDFIWLLLGTAAIAGSAGGANQIWERVIDRQMPRTANRPLPGGRMSRLEAASFTALIGIFGTGMLLARFGPVPAAIGVITWLVYVVAYTPMKTRSSWNTTVGAIAGALPILIGYTAAGGGLGDATGWLLFGVLAAWQFPHFMAIAWMYRRQYGEAGFTMTTTVDPSGRWAGVQSVAGSLALIGCGVALAFGSSGWLGGVIASIGVTLFAYPMLAASCRFAASPDDGRARKMLRSSLLVLPAVLSIVTLNAIF